MNAREQLARWRDAVEADAPMCVAVPVTRIGGKRWSAWSDLPPTRDLPVGAPRLLALDDIHGLMVYGWEDIPPGLRARLEKGCAGEHRG